MAVADLAGSRPAATPARRSMRLPSAWSLWPTAGAALVTVPLIVILAHLGAVPGELVSHLATTVLPRYLGSTAVLVTGVGLLTALLGMCTAWVVTMYEFPGRRLLSWALALPLAIPPYIAAYTAAGTFGFTGAAQRFFRVTLGLPSGSYPVLDVYNLPGAAVILALTLYPYVYLVCRASLQMQSRGLLEAARSLQASALHRFLRVALPLTRPALVGGVALVVMEVLNDYGAVSYLGVDTFTTGIFRAWFSFGEPASALGLAGALLVLILGLLALERRARGRARFGDTRTPGAPFRPAALRGMRAAAALLVCLVPVLLGFVYPVTQLGAWAVITGAASLRGGFLRLTLNTSLLAAAAAGVVVAASLLVAYAVRVRRGSAMSVLAGLAGVGYAVPGAVIALGVMTALAGLDRLLGLSGAATRVALSGTLLALVYAYLVRFFAVGYNTIDAGMARTCGRLDEVARTLGHSPGRALLRVDIPLLRRPLLTAGLLVFTDVLKELPLTLILRPFGLETLATRVWQLAGNEQVAESAVVSLLIVAAGLVPAMLLASGGTARRA